MSQQEKKIFSSVHINRITVEFKFLRVSLYYPFSSILIESQWNLNEMELVSVPICDLHINRITLNTPLFLGYIFLNVNINRITVEFK